MNVLELDDPAAQSHGPGAAVAVLLDANPLGERVPAVAPLVEPVIVDDDRGVPELCLAEYRFGKLFCWKNIKICLFNTISCL